MHRILRISTTAVLAGAIVLVVPTPGNAALSPNDSVFFYQPSVGVVTGTIHNGTYTQVDNPFSVGTGWTAAALTRDTLVLLNAPAQELGLATLTAGNYAATTGVFIKGSNFSKVTASCDSALFYTPSNGRALAIHLTAGLLDLKHAHAYTLGKNFTSVNASCNTVSLLNSKGTGIIGTLKNGTFVKKGTLKTGMANALVVHTATSFMRYSKSSGKLEWGTSNNGVEHLTGGPVFDLDTVSKLAGTGTSVLSYDSSTGKTATAELVNGVLSNSEQESFTAGWQIIVGGR